MIREVAEEDSMYKALREAVKSGMRPADGRKHRLKGGDVPANYVMKVDTKIMSDEVKKPNVVQDLRKVK